MKPKLVPRLENAQDSKHKRSSSSSSSKCLAGVGREGGQEEKDTASCSESAAELRAGDLGLHGGPELPDPQGAQGPCSWQDENQKAQRGR